MRIGELATLAGIPAKTIRYYEGIGLLDPPARTPAGYRDYEPDVCDRIGFIRAAQAAGLTLGEIRGIVALRDRGETPCSHVLGLLTARHAEIDQRIAELRAVSAELDRLATRARRLDPANCDPRRVCHLLGTDA